MSNPVATTPLTYNLYVTQMGVMAVVNTQTVGGIVQGVDTGFNAIMPQMLNYAELRIQRDLNLLPMRQVIAYSTTIGMPYILVSTNDFVVINTVSLPNINPLLAVSKEYVQNVYVGVPEGTPQVFYVQGATTVYDGDMWEVALSPTPDQIYTVNITGEVRMPSLYLNSVNSTLASTGQTFISTWLPDLLIMASMIYISAYQRNFGRQSDDPQMSVSYESQYQTLLKGAVIEEARKRFTSGAWSSEAPATIATPTR